MGICIRHRLESANACPKDRPVPTPYVPAGVTGVSDTPRAIQNAVRLDVVGCAAAMPKNPQSPSQRPTSASSQIRRPASPYPHTSPRVPILATLFPGYPTPIQIDILILGINGISEIYGKIIAPLKRMAKYRAPQPPRV